MRCVLAVLVILATLAASPGAAQAAGWKPHMRDATQFALARDGVTAIAVHTQSDTYGFRARRQFYSASVLKSMLLVAYLRQRDVRSRPLTRAEERLLGPMIRRSANKPASALVTRLGAARISRFARRAGMRSFVPVTGLWGRSLITAEDQARYFMRIDSLIPPRHREYAMGLLETIVERQRWGVARVQPAGWRLYFKGGWGSGTGAVENQVALLTNGERRISLAILTHRSRSHAYAKKTLEGVARRLLRGLAADGA